MGYDFNQGYDALGKTHVFALIDLRVFLIHLVRDLAKTEKPLPPYREFCDDANEPDA